MQNNDHNRDNASPRNNSVSSNFLKTDKGKTKSNAIEVPSISLPKGGGAIKSIDEKFSVNAVNGTASFSVPLPFSPARGASPAVSLQYNSGSGNCIFGLGWSLELASIKRKTDKKLPRYVDGPDSDSDVFLFSESEDLVPEFQKENDDSFSIDADGDYITKKKDSPDGLYSIKYYKPRIEGLFARIERWTEKLTGKINWRVITKDNVTTLFGWTNNAVIMDPADNKKIFKWLPEFVFDDKGNCSHYIYKKEDKIGFDISLLHNKNRFANGDITYTNLYVEKILYGNKTPYKNFSDPFPAAGDYMFQAIFDYGEYDTNSPYSKIKNWDFRNDAFSEYKAGFEIRTTRLCKRVLFFHLFNELPGGSALVKSMDFEYDMVSEKGFTFLKSFTVVGYIKKAGGGYTNKSLPPVEFTYQPHEWNKKINSLSSEDLVHAPSGFDGQQYQFTDLFNEGLSGILTEQSGNWYYKHNLGDGKFEEAKLVAPKPSFAGLNGQVHLADLDADGGRQLVNYNNEPKGYFELNDDNQWESFKSFRALPNINFNDPNTRMLDLNGDGRPELLITEDNVFTWYESGGRNGFSGMYKEVKFFDEELGPHILFSDRSQSIFLADMSGNGMTDIIRIRNGETCYWPNMGYGKFGAKITLDNSPFFDHPDLFNPAFLRLADIDGSGTTDIIYLGKNKFTCWMNLSGNKFSVTPFNVDAFPEIHDRANITVTDLLGNGVSCIVWCGGLTKDKGMPLHYIDLMRGKKPHVMIFYKNNLGKEVSLQYTPSTKFYIADKLAGNPWITKLHFPVHCISEAETRDKISGSRFVSSYKYHHGHYNHYEREFAGFGMVEQIDSEDFEHWIKGDATNIVDKELHQEPVVTKTWFHTGAFLRREKILSQFATEYWYEEMIRQGFPIVHHETSLTDARIIPTKGIPASVIDDLSAEEWREALRACKSMALRSEIFAHDAPAIGATPAEIMKQLTPYSVTTHNCVIELLQPKGKNRHAIFLVKESERISYNYERDITDPRIAHNLNIKLDEYGNILEAAAVVYPRLLADATLPAVTQAEQNKTVIIYSQSEFTKDVIAGNVNLLRLPSETKSFELKGVSKTGSYYSIKDFENILTVANETAYFNTDTEPPAGSSQKRLIEQIRNVYYRNDLTGPLPLHQLNSPAIPFESFQLAYTPALINDIYAGKATNLHLAEGKFIHTLDENNIEDANWWIRSGSTQFIQGAETKADAANRFYSPLSYTDPYGTITKAKYDQQYFLFIEETEDHAGNKTKIDLFNYRILSPQRMKDINNNLSEVLCDELGLVKAMAVMGKDSNNDGIGEEADELTGLTDFTDPPETALVTNFFNVVDSVSLTAVGKNLLQRATARFVYDLDVYKNTGKPTVVATIIREDHFKDNNNPPVQLSFEYSNGLGKVAMKKAQAEPGSAKKVIINPGNTYLVTVVDTAALNPKQLRWIGNGRTVLNNKGNPVKQYEHYFSVTHQYEDIKELVETGVTPIIYYDAIDRPIRTVMPDETFFETRFNSWKQLEYDANDTILNSPWYTNRTNRLIDAQLIGEGKDPVKEKAAADKAANHADTPAVFHFDTLGRAVLSVDHNKDLVTNADIYHRTKVKLDTEDNLRIVTDAREIPENLNKGNTVMQYKYDMLGNLVYRGGMDAGKKWLLINILGNPLRTWDERNHEFQYSYDDLHRLLQCKVTGGGGTPLNNIFERVVYGESLLLPGRTNEAALQAKNILGQPINHFDTAGVIETPEYDFKNQAKSTTRKLFKNYKSVADWIDANLVNDLEAPSFTFTTKIDALNRIKEQTTPDGSIITPSYNEAGLLNGETVTHINPAATTVYIKDIDYNERAQRNKIIYGNDVTTKFYYDKETFRLNRLESKRLNGEVLQNLFYTSDAVGNITTIEDKAIPITFFANSIIEPVSEYTYDALYRLVEAKGRENNAALNFDTEDNWNDKAFMHDMNPGDPMAIRNYMQTYQYDQVGNITQIQQTLGNNWTRIYEYEKSNNRLRTTQVGAEIYTYTHHAQHGFILSMPHLDDLGWSFKEELVKTIRQKVLPANGTAETTYYQYDNKGERIRKITENSAAATASPTKKDERIYVSGYELYIQHSGANSGLRRISLNLIDEGHRFVIIETRNDVNDGTDIRLVRYQLHNHLGSAALELDSGAGVISYEEYHPFGTTAYQAKNTAIRSAAKRYRYTGMERDDETGLEYHMARYYLPWLGRWLNADPIGIKDGPNVYVYSRNNPMKFLDPQGTQCNDVDISGCPRGTPPPAPVTTGTLLPSADANGGGPPRDPPPSEPTPRVLSPYQLTSEFLEATGDSSRQFQLRGGVLSPEFRAPSYPVTGTEQIGPSLGRAFKLVLSEHPQLKADLGLFGSTVWRENRAPILAFGIFGLAGIATAAGAGNEWGPASLLPGLLTLIPEATTRELATGPGSPGDLYFRRIAFQFRDSTPIGTNEGQNVLGIFPTLQFRGQYLDRDLTLTVGANARYLPQHQELRVQESLAVDYNLIRFDIGSYRASFGAEGRVNWYQQIDLAPDVRSSSPPHEGTFMFQFRITEPPARPRTPGRFRDSP